MGGAGFRSACGPLIVRRAHAVTVRGAVIRPAESLLALMNQSPTGWCCVVGILTFARMPRWCVHDAPGRPPVSHIAVVEP